MLYTPTQAAAVTGLPLKSVQKAIDSRSVPVRLRRVRGLSKRYLSEAGLLCLRLEAEGLNQFPARLRKRIYRGVVEKPSQGRIRFSDVVWIDLAEVRRAVATALDRLKKAEAMIISDPDTMGGAPVFQGTRVPVHTIATMLRSGTPAAEILAGYPSLNQEQVALAEIYAQAHPKRGRPPIPPWSGQKPIRRMRKRLDSAA